MQDFWFFQLRQVNGRTLYRVSELWAHVPTSVFYLQPDQINMAVFFWNLVKSDLSSERYCTRVPRTRHFMKGTRNTRPFLTGHSVSGLQAVGQPPKVGGGGDPGFVHGQCHSNLRSIQLVDAPPTHQVRHGLVGRGIYSPKWSDKSSTSYMIYSILKDN